MKLPRTGTWCMILWTDAARADGWTDDGEEHAQVIEITTGMVRGKTADKKLRIASTVSLGIEDGSVYYVLGGVEIPIGTIACWYQIKEPPEEAARKS